MPVSKQKWLQGFARFGLTVKGIVYCLVGTLAFLAALGLSSKKGDKTSALKTVYEQPFGRVLLVVIAVGLAGYVTLRAYQAFADSNHKGSDAKGIFSRLRYGFSALLYTGLCISAFKLAIGNGDSSGSKEGWLQQLMAHDAGPPIFMISGMITIGLGLYQGFRAVTGRFMKRVHLYRSGFGDAFKRIGTIGYTARGIVLCLLGYFFLRAGIDHNSNEANGTGEAFDFLEQKFGRVWMAVVALGLFAYGVFMFVRARHEDLRLR